MEAHRPSLREKAIRLAAVAAVIASTAFLRDSRSISAQQANPPLALPSPQTAPLSETTNLWQNVQFTDVPLRPTFNIAPSSLSSADWLFPEAYLP